MDGDFVGDSERNGRRGRAWRILEVKEGFSCEKTSPHIISGAPRESLQGGPKALLGFLIDN